jgi:hypothetical protein
MKKIGIWIDQREAYIIDVSDQKIDSTRIESTIENYHPKGGSKSKMPWGPVETVSEKKYLERNKHQEQEFFKNILGHLKDSEGVFLFGPAEIKNKLFDFLNQQKRFPIRLLGVKTADSMTANQRVATVKAFYGVKLK